MAIGFSVDPKTVVSSFGTRILVLRNSCCKGTRIQVRSAVSQKLGQLIPEMCGYAIANCDDALLPNLIS